MFCIFYMISGHCSKLLSVLEVFSVLFTPLRKGESTGSTITMPLTLRHISACSRITPLCSFSILPSFSPWQEVFLPPSFFSKNLKLFSVVLWKMVFINSPMIFPCWEVKSNYPPDSRFLPVLPRPWNGLSSSAHIKKPLVFLFSQW